jgi:hypothetical protein
MHQSDAKHRAFLTALLGVSVVLSFLAGYAAATLDARATSSPVAVVTLPSRAGLPVRVLSAAQTETAVMIGVVIRHGTSDTIVCLPGVPDCPLVATQGPAATPTPLATAIPTNTLKPTLPPAVTITLPPSATPTSFHTPTATPSPAPSQTPTEPFLTPTPPPTSTPGTSTPPPVGKTCEAVVAIARGINVRDVPDVSGNHKTTLAQGSRVVISSFWKAGGFLWAQVPALAGYMVVGEYTTPFGWWVTFSNNEFCTGLGSWPPELTPPPEVALQVGLHVLLGAAEAPIFVTLPTWGVLKCLTGTQHICLEGKRRNPNLIIIFRALNTCAGMTDGPPLAMWYMPDVWYACIKPSWPEGFDYYEIINEVGPPGDDYVLFARFNIDVAAAAARDGKCVLAFSFGPGNPEINRWSDLLAYLLWANAHPCAPGKYPGVALHQSAYLPSNAPLQVGQWVNSVWVAGRDWVADGYLQLNHQFSLRDFHGPIYLTEIGLQDGYSGSWDDRWGCATLALSIAETRDRLKARPWITGFNWWNVGGVAGGRWSDDGPCLAAFARALQ